jgi:hypothetical protein
VASAYQSHHRAGPCPFQGRAGIGARIPYDFRRTAIRNLERAGVPRSPAMAMVGHLTESVYRRYAIQDEGMLNEAAAKLEAFQSTPPGSPTVIAIDYARTPPEADAPGSIRYESAAFPGAGPNRGAKPE